MHTHRYVILLFVILAVAAFAADAPAAGNDPSVSLGLSAIGVDISGNAQRFGQYATPPDGMAAGIVLHLLNPAGQALDLDAPLITGTYRRGNLWMLATPSLALSFDHVMSRFYADPDPGEEQITALDTTADATVELGHATLLFSNHDLRKKTFTNTGDDVYKTSQPGVDFLLPLGQGVAGIGYTHNAFAMDGAEFDGSDQTVRVRMSPWVNARTAVEATAAFTRTVLQAPVSTPNRTQLGLTATHALSPRLTLNGEVTSNSLSEVFTRNGFAKRDTNLQARADYSGLARTRVTVGAGTRSVDYVNDIQTLQANSQVTNYFAGLTMRPTKLIRVKASMNRWSSSDRPERNDVFGDPTGVSVVWTRRDQQKAEVTVSPSWRTGLTASWQRYAWVNGDVNAQSSLNQHDLNLWWLPRENLTVYTALTNQAYGLLGLNPTDGPSASNANSLVTGFSLQLTPMATFDASYTDVTTNGGESNKQHILGVGFTSKLAHGELSLRFARDLFRENVAAPTLNYDANYTEGRYSLEF